LQSHPEIANSSCGTVADIPNPSGPRLEPFEVTLSSTGTRLHGNVTVRCRGTPRSNHAAHVQCMRRAGRGDAYIASRSLKANVFGPSSVVIVSIYECAWAIVFHEQPSRSKVRA